MKKLLTILSMCTSIVMCSAYARAQIADGIVGTEDTTIVNFANKICKSRNTIPFFAKYKRDSADAPLRGPSDFFLLRLTKETAVQVCSLEAGRIQVLHSTVTNSDFSSYLYKNSCITLEATSIRLLSDILGVDKEQTLKGCYRFGFDLKDTARSSED